MKKIPLQILFFLLFLMNISCNGQEKIIYHEFEPTASDFRITKWNLLEKELSNYYLSEKIDSKNRVTELKFYKNEQNDFEYLCFLPTWIKYEYPNDKMIIQTNLNYEGVPESNIECELPSKIIYHLSENQKEIVKTEYEYEFDHKPYLKIGWTEKYIKQLIDELKSYEKNSNLVDSYSKSLVKLNGIFPVSNEFDLKIFYFSELEKEKIKDGIK